MEMNIKKGILKFEGTEKQVESVILEFAWQTGNKDKVMKLCGKYIKDIPQEFIEDLNKIKFINSD